MPDKTKNVAELQMAEMAEMQKKLVAMEMDLKKKCEEYDNQVTELAEREQQLSKREKAFDKKHGTLTDSESFGEMVTLIDKVYTLYVSSHSSDKGLYDSIKLLLDAREKYNTKHEK